MSGLSDRWQTLSEFARMVRDRKLWVMLPLILAIAAVLVFASVAEMPVLIPFFYAVF